MNHARTSPLLCKPAHQFSHSLCGGECLPQPEQHSTLHSRVACGDFYIFKYFYIAFSALIFVLLSRVANVYFHVNLKILSGMIHFLTSQSQPEKVVPLEMIGQEKFLCGDLSCYNAHLLLSLGEMPALVNQSDTGFSFASLSNYLL